MTGITDVTAAVEAYAADEVSVVQAKLDAANKRIADLEAQLNPAPAPAPSPAPSGSIAPYYGICDHTTYRTSPQYGNDTKTRELVVKAKATFVRDRLSTNTTQDTLMRSYVTAGIKAWHMTVGTYGDALSQLPGLVSRLAQSADIVDQVTGWNEPDGNGARSTWLPPTAAWQKALYQQVKANAKTAHIKVGLGALRGANPNLAADQAALMAACVGFYDFVDLHVYPGPKTDADIVKLLASRLGLAQGHPVVVSEYGGSTANMSLADQARVCATGAKFLASKGVRFFVYEVWDDPDPTGKVLQSNFGIYESDGSDKPAVAALRSLV